MGDGENAADIELGPYLEHGSPQPLGASLTPRGVNFAVFSGHAQRIDLCLFDAAGRETARLELPSRTGDIWHGLLPASFGGAGTLYGYRVHGPYQPAEGHRFNPAKLLVDPCAAALEGGLTWHPALRGAEPGNDWLPDENDSAPYVPKCRVVDSAFDWGGVRAPSVPWRDTVIYELHVKGFTQRHPGIPEHLRGKYLGLAHPAALDHLRSLGVTTVELMPVQSFVSEEFLVRKGLSNYWGYNPLAWFAPDARYAVVDPVVEFKTMVRALHDAGIEVVLDVVFNHTAEGNEDGPTLSLRGFDNATYYRLFAHNRAHYKNFSGCGNTVSFDDPAVRGLVLDCLRYWTDEMRVDGFRFDLAPIVGRDAAGFSSSAPFFAELRSDPVLAYVKFIAEPWDVGPGGYQLGHFPAGWSEWNDRYRDTVRAFWRGDPGLVGAFAERFAGSSDLFRHHGRKPTASINFLASHDGFTLRDTRHLLPAPQRGQPRERHRRPHPQPERELRRGGTDGRPRGARIARRASCATSSPRCSFRRACRCCSRATRWDTRRPATTTPIARTTSSPGSTGGLLECSPGLVRFVRRLADLRRSRLWLRRDTFLKGTQRKAGSRDIAWLHPSGREMTEHDWNDASLHCLALHMTGAVDARASEAGDVLAVFNASAVAVDLVLPEAAHGTAWRMVLDTEQVDGEAKPLVVRCKETLRLAPRCTVLLESQQLPAAS